MIVTAFVVLSIRFGLYSLLTPSTVHFGILIEMVHSLSLILMDISTMIFISHLAPSDLVSTGQTVKTSFNRLGAIIGGSVSSYVYSRYGGKVFMRGCSYSLMGLVGLVILALYWGLKYQESHREDKQEVSSICSSQDIEMKQSMLIK